MLVDTNKTSKSIIASIVIVCICISITSCGAKDAGVLSPYSAEQIAEIIIAAQTDAPELFPLTPGDGLFSDYISAQYKLDAGDIADGIVFYAEGADATEIAILLLKGTANVKKTSDALGDYKERRVSTLTGYVPIQAEIAERGIIATRGAYAALLICSDSASAERVFISCFSSDPPKLPDKSAASQTLPSGDAPEAGAESSAGDDAKHPEPAAGPGGAELPERGIAQGAEQGDPAKDAANDELPGGNMEGPGRADGEAAAAESPPAKESPELSGEESGGKADEGQSAAQNPSGTPPSTQQPQPPATPQPSDSAQPPSAVIDDIYDPAAVLAAWRSGDASRLSEKNSKILEACTEIIRSRIRNGMSDYEKELAIHDWIVLWTNYDVEASNNSPGAKPDPDNNNPYGLFFSRKSICSGYSSTFQLLMDMVGVECITVRGHARNMDTEHAWNMVRLDGEWYCVDVTWNDPVGAPPDYLSHEYFNVTSQYLRDTRHIWDEASVPEATATAFSWAVMSGESG